MNEESLEDIDLAADLENWMTNLPQSLKAIPIIHLAIPGKKQKFDNAKISMFFSFRFS